MNPTKVAISVLVVLALLVIGAVLVDAWLDSEPTAILESIRTDVSHFDAGANQMERLFEGDRRRLVTGDGVTVDQWGNAWLDMGGCVLDIFRDSGLNIGGLPSEGSQLCVLGLEHGTIFNSVERRMIVDADWAVITTLGTEFLVHLDLDRGLLWVVVTEGRVLVEAAGAEVYVRAGQQTWVREGSPPEPTRPATRGEVGDLFPSVADLTNDIMTDSDVLVPEDTVEPHPSLTLSQSTDRVFAGECGEPRTVHVVATVHGSAEDLEGVRAARLTHRWEGGDEHAMTMEREADDRFSAEIGPFDYCCEETPLFYTVELLGAAGRVLETGRSELLLSYCEEEPGELPLSLTLEQSTDRVFAGECGDPRTAEVIARLDGPAEALERVYAARLTYRWEGGDAHAMTMGREADDIFFAEMGPFDYCCDETPLFYTVTLLGAGGDVLKTGRGEILLTYCEEGAPIVVMGPYVGDELETGLRAVNDRFTELTGIEVLYEPVVELDMTLVTRVEAGDPPDVAFLHNPTAMWRHAGAGDLVPLWPAIIERIEGNYAPSWLELGAYEGRPYGVVRRVSPKSLVWYPRAYFEEFGYQIPRTWDELIALSDQIAADGGTPWCIGIESGAASGWVGTDWIEDVMLRTAGPRIYDQWWQHQIPFDDERVLRAGVYVEEIWFNDDFVLGGRGAIRQANYVEASLPMFDDPPGCYLHRQGSFIVDFWPQEIQDTLDQRVGVFVLPAIAPEYGAPLLVGADQAVMFNDRPGIRAYMEYLTTGISVEPVARAGDALFPHRDQDLGWYSSDVERTIAELAVNAEVVRFDASDLMPPEIGAGAFWAGMVDWVEGVDLNSILDRIEESWP